MPPPPPLPIRLCPKHGLVAGPDGRCMICHRGAAEIDTASPTRRLVVGLVAVVAVASAVMVWKVRPKPAPLADAQAQPAYVAQPQAAAAEPDEPSRPPPSLDEAQAVAHMADEQQRQRSIEAEMRKVPVRMYMGKTCAICDDARDWFKEKGMACSEVDVNADPAAMEALRKLTPDPVLPTFDVDGEVLQSFAPTVMLGAVRRAAEKRARQ
jgi:glutaredoxin